MNILRIALLGSLLLSPALSLDEDNANDKQRPVTKVVNLLKGMIAQLEKEAKEDEEIYDKMACWCATNDREKTKEIAEAEQAIARLESEIQQHTANSARLNTEIESLNGEVAKNTDSLDKAEALRKKQLADYTEEEKDMLEAISALKSAITVLSKHHKGSFLQISTAHMEGMAASVQSVMERHSSMLEGILTRSQRDAVNSYAKGGPSGYAPQSGEIFGILQSMLEEFQRNLKESTGDDVENEKVYQQVKAAKETEIEAGQTQSADKTDILAETDSKNANAKEELTNTKESLDADQKYLAELKKKCSMTDGVWEERQKTRQAEIEACSKALAVLSGDDAHDLFTKTFNAASFIQKTSKTNSAARNKASDLLKETASKTEDPKLAAIAMQVKLDAFTRVKEAIDKMIEELGQEKAEEIKHKDWCTSEFNQNENSQNKKTTDKEHKEAHIATLEQEIEQLADAIKTLTQELSDLALQMKHAGEDREKENMEFQVIIKDQRDTQALLKNALKQLEIFYKKKAFVQVKDEPAGPPAPEGFGEYKKNSNSGGVMQLLTDILNDAINMEKEATREEQDTQKSYEDFVISSNQVRISKQKDLVDRKKEKADKEEDHSDANKEHAALVLDLEQLANYKLQLHKSCDFILKNFDVRQTARDQEVEALRQAKSILSGSMEKAD